MDEKTFKKREKLTSLQKNPSTIFVAANEHLQICRNGNAIICRSFNDQSSTPFLNPTRKNENLASWNEKACLQNK